VSLAACCLPASPGLVQLLHCGGGLALRAACALQQCGSGQMADSTAMTVDFLRARLLSERSVSRAAKERADELAKRVRMVLPRGVAMPSPVRGTSTTALMCVTFRSRSWRSRSGR
jgi:hypothetical protein